MQIRAHKIRVLPTPDQEVYLKKACGCARFAYNWALAEWEKRYRSGERVTSNILQKKFDAIKRQEFPWILESTKCATVRSIRNLGTAMTRFFKKQAAFPRFKKKEGKNSFYVENSAAEIIEKNLFLPKYKEPFKLSERVRFKGKIMSYTLSKDVDRWHVSVSVETEDKLNRIENRSTVGIDLGIKTMATLSDGTVFPSRPVDCRCEKRINRWQRKLSRASAGSSNHAKTKRRLALMCRKLRLSNKDYLHSITTFISQHYAGVVIENLNTAGLLKNHCIARSLQRMSFGAFRSMLKYKCAMTDTSLVLADRFYPSSKLCSRCGSKKSDLKLSDRVYRCTVCGLEIDRDLNAAVNLKKLGACCPKVKPVEKAEVNAFREAGTELVLVGQADNKMVRTYTGEYR